MNDLCSQLKLDTHGYALSECRNKINASLTRPGRDIYINNRRLKNLLMEKFGEDLCFTYSRKRQDSQMFFSSKVKSTDIAEQVRSIDVIIKCAKRIRNQMKNYNFDLDESYCDAYDISLIYDVFVKNRPLEWNTFCSALLDHEVILTARQRICDTVFQIIYKMIHRNRKRTPLTTALSQANHDVSRSRHLIDLFCRLGLAVSCDKVGRIDMNIVQRTIERTGNHRVSVPPSIKSSNTIHAATDNFDQNDSKGGSHDTILMFFQNPKVYEEKGDEIQRIGSKHENLKRFQKLPETLPCHRLIRAYRGQFRGAIPEDYTVREGADKGISVEVKLDHVLWQLTRYIVGGLPIEEVFKMTFPSFSAVKQSQDRTYSNSIHTYTAISCNRF